ncbi:MAG: hypothetical protein IPM82_16545 [Saprospiraceae bacterium]|nr:hypothetical protein [Saprospiraceae bacterium]
MSSTSNLTCHSSASPSNCSMRQRPTGHRHGTFALPERPPVGKQTLRFSYIGYEGVTIPNVVVTAGKEVFLEVKMTESYTQL